MSETERTILVVDDEPEQRRVVGKMLERLGWSVLFASGGEEAWQMLRYMAEPVHVLLTDVVMPTSTGPMLVQQVRRAYPEIRIVFMSGFSPEVLQWYDLEPDSVAFLPKPFDLDELRQALDAVDPDSAAAS